MMMLCCGQWPQPLVKYISFRQPFCAFSLVILSFSASRHMLTAMRNSVLCCWKESTLDADDVEVGC